MKNIDLTNTNELIRLKESLNGVIDNKIEEAKVKQIMESVSELPFLTCRRLLESTLPEIYDKKEGKAIIRDYVKLMKENRSMFTSYVTYDNILRSDNISNPDVFVSTCMSLKENISNREMREGMKKLRDITVEAINLTRPNFETLKEEIERDKVLCEALDKVFIGKHTVHNTATYADNLNVIMENVKKRCSSTVTEENTYNESTIKENMTKINEMLNDDNLEYWQRELIGKAITYNMAYRGEELFEEYKNQCINLLTESCEDADESENNRNKMKTMIGQLNEKKYNKESFLDDIVKMGSLMETIKKS